MVNGVKLTMINQVDDIRRLDDRLTGLFEDRFYACHKSIQIGDMSQNVIGEENIGFLAILDQFLRQALAQRM